MSAAVGKTPETAVEPCFSVLHPQALGTQTTVWGRATYDSGVKG